MARYFFDIVNGEGPMRDDEGVELADAAAVRNEVGRIAMDLASDEIPDEAAVDIVVNVRDQGGRKVFVGKLHFDGQWQAD